MRRQSPAALAVLLLLATLGTASLPGAEREPRPAARRPNIVVLSVDSLRKASLRKASLRKDDPRLPNLNLLLRRSAVFERALSTASWTLPAHASLMTGLYPDRHGATDPRLRIAPELPVLAL
ncbi:MAG TPA: alkaline phosphatase family protein, partial [Thermoanaerobaculia bacterium]|nr:alkaline phosphatase family protein [Thermoanaerobaculia bacterium]